jgi:thiol-disulfide isomerase/thioredoxin
MSFDHPRWLFRYTLTLLVLAGCGASSSGSGEHADDARSGSVVGRLLPDLQLASLHGSKAVRMSDLRGKVVLLDVWASWCGPCKQELPMLDDMATRLRGRGVEIVAVSIDDSRDDAETFLRSRPTWSMRLAHDPDGKVPGKLQPAKMPSSYIVDRKGVIRQVNAGFERTDAQKIEARLLQMASGK